MAFSLFKFTLSTFYSYNHFWHLICLFFNWNIFFDLLLINHFQLVHHLFLVLYFIYTFNYSPTLSFSPLQGFIGPHCCLPLSQIFSCWNLSAYLSISHHIYAGIVQWHPFSPELSQLILLVLLARFFFSNPVSHHYTHTP